MYRKIGWVTIECFVEEPNKAIETELKKVRCLTNDDNRKN